MLVNYFLLSLLTFFLHCYLFVGFISAVFTAFHSNYHCITNDNQNVLCLCTLGMTKAEIVTLFLNIISLCFDALSPMLFQFPYPFKIDNKIREKSRECHLPDTKRNRKPTNPNKHKSNKRRKSTKISSLFPR